MKKLPSPVPQPRSYCVKLTNGFASFYYVVDKATDADHASRLGYAVARQARPFDRLTVLEVAHYVPLPKPPTSPLRPSPGLPLCDAMEGRLDDGH